MASQYSSSLDDTIEVVSKLNPAIASYLRVDDSIDAMQDKQKIVADALSLFLQGLGYIPRYRLRGIVPGGDQFPIIQWVTTGWPLCQCVYADRCFSCLSNGAECGVVSIKDDSCTTGARFSPAQQYSKASQETWRAGLITSGDGGRWRTGNSADDNE